LSLPLALTIKFAIFSLWIIKVAHFIKCSYSYPDMGNQQKGLDSAETLYRKHGGMLRASEAVALGIHPRTLYRLRDENRLVAISRGLYRLADLPELSDPDLVSVATRVPQAVICRISARFFHAITTQIPLGSLFALLRHEKR